MRVFTLFPFQAIQKMQSFETTHYANLNKNHVANSAYKFIRPPKKTEKRTGLNKLRLEV